MAYPFSGSSFVSNALVLTDCLATFCMFKLRARECCERHRIRRDLEKNNQKAKNIF